MHRHRFSPYSSVDALLHEQCGYNDPASRAALTNPSNPRVTTEAKNEEIAVEDWKPLADPRVKVRPLTKEESLIRHKHLHSGLLPLDRRKSLFANFRNVPLPSTPHEYVKEALQKWIDNARVESKAIRRRLCEPVKGSPKPRAEQYGEIRTLESEFHNLNEEEYLFKILSEPLFFQNYGGRFTVATRVMEAYQNKRLTLDFRGPNLLSMPDCLHHFTDLQALVVDGKYLKNVSRFPPNLKTLDVTSEELSELPAFPAGLEVLRLTCSSLKSLPALPSALKDLGIYGPSLKTLPELPPTLTTFTVSGFGGERLPPFPPKLERIFISRLSVPLIPVLPEGLRQLTLAGRFDRLPALPLSLTYIDLTYCDGPMTEHEHDARFYKNRFSTADTGRLRSLFMKQVQSPEFFDVHNLSGAASSTTVLSEFAQVPKGAAVHNGSLLAASRNNERDVFDEQTDLARALSLSLHQSNTASLGWGTASLLSYANYIWGYSSGSTQSGATGEIQPSIGPDGSPLARWQLPGSTVEELCFNEFTTHLVEAAEYYHPLASAVFERRVDNLVLSIRNSPELRKVCCVIAADAMTSCSDRVLLGLNDMEMAKIDHEAKSGKYDNAKLFSLAEGMFKLKVIDDVAVARLKKFRDEGVDVDEVEVRLSYQVGLAYHLSLPGVGREMIFSSRLNRNDFREAEQAVRTQLQRSARIDFIADWRRWRLAMERQHPEEYEKKNADFQAPRDAISIQPEHVSDQEWLNAFDQQAALEKSLLHSLTVGFTRQHLSSHALSRFGEEARYQSWTFFRSLTSGDFLGYLQR